ncbi:zinc-dependent metalloprotease [Sandarakinorhabdus rubra]|uniref:zinc-dependent metalloprotease n=1 Tax=Sandarakinorhabdus rubra TaxID=2672568 RepID=UPI0013DD3F03|nr:zinc-dependent metalloprotease [Sandarakinorhabdus rubra]
MTRWLIGTALAILAGTAQAQTDAAYLPLNIDAAKNRVLLTVPALDTDILYYVSLASGGGSVELPLDRGTMDQAVIRFRRAGSRILVEEQNLAFRSLTGDAAHKAGVADSFPTTVIASLPIEQEVGGRITVDATALILRDAAGVEAILRRQNQGAYRFDAGRSALNPARSKAFPLNTEVELFATYSADNPGALVRGVTPSAEQVTMRVHHSFLKAPAPGYTPRVADPRIGVSAIRFKDFSQNVANGIDTEWVTRWRLEKKDPNAALSEPVTPITVYFDLAIPAPIRHAMKQGLLWWNKAYEAAGFKNALVAKDAPADMDPQDIRYNFMQWINRDERGFSSGGAYRDPRTGEILGAKVRMDSHRIRTIANYWDAYAGALPGDGSGVTVADPALVTGDFGTMPKGQRDMVLLRQALLTAHEFGHALGFGHNFASSLNNRASVMEYPTPRVKVKGGRIDLSESFQTAIGAYDTMMVRYAYTPLADEKAGLDAIIADMRRQGLIYVPDTDPRWTWYDDRATPAEGLSEALAARRLLIATYGADSALLPGEPVGELRNLRLWMVYLHHRYQVESAVKYIGGLYTDIKVKGEPGPATSPIPAKLQRDTLGLLLQSLSPAELALPEKLLADLTPDPGRNLEDLSDDPVFDPLRAARIAAALVVEPLLAPDRATRLVALEARGIDGVTLPQLVDALMAASWNAPAPRSARDAALLRVVQKSVLDGLMILGASASTAPEARALALQTLADLARALPTRAGDTLGAAFNRQTAADISAYLADPAAKAPKAVSLPWGAGPRSRFPQPPGPPL